MTTNSLIHYSTKLTIYFPFSPSPFYIVTIIGVWFVTMGRKKETHVNYGFWFIAKKKEIQLPSVL